MQGLPTVLIVGQGSIGRRHDLLLKERGVHTLVASAHAADADFKDLSTALATCKPQYIIVATSTIQHIEDVRLIEATCRGVRVLIEKPLFHSPFNLALEKNEYYVAYNLRYHPGIRQLETALRNEKILSANIHVGSYLPNWRSAARYQDSYSADANRGGGALLDLSHELDYICSLFGAPRRVAAMMGHWSCLEISSEDTVQILLETKSNVRVSLQLDYLSRMPIRRGIIQTDTKTIEYDLISNQVSDSTLGQSRFEVKRDDTYIAEHHDLLSPQPRVLCTYNQGLQVVSLCTAVQQANAQEKWIYLQ